MPVDPATMLSVGSAVLGAGSGLVGMFTEAAKERKAKEELSRLAQPFYKIQDEYFQNRNIAGAAAGQGMPSATRDYVTTQTERGLGAGISAIQQGGGSPSDVANLFDVFTQSTNAIGAKDAEIQLQNIRGFMDANKEVAAQKNIQWGVNEFQPYQNKLKEITQRRAAAELNQNNFLNQAIGSTAAAGTALTNQKLLEGLMKGNEASPTNNDFMGMAIKDLQAKVAQQGQNKQPAVGKFSSGQFDGAGMVEQWVMQQGQNDPGFQQFMANRAINLQSK